MHLPPNAAGLLYRLGIDARACCAADEVERITEYAADGEAVRDMEGFGDINRARWQHPWLLVHRVALHDELKRVATADEEENEGSEVLGGRGIGAKVVLHTTAKVVLVDPEGGVVRLQDGTKCKADVVLGADGVYVRTIPPCSSQLRQTDSRLTKTCGTTALALQSQTRNFVTDDIIKPFGSGKAAFRFLLPRKAALDDAVTRPLASIRSGLAIWFGSDRRVVMYPCNKNATLNFVCIHPDAETSGGAQATPSPAGDGDDGRDGWDGRTTAADLVAVFDAFSPALKALLAKAGDDHDRFGAPRSLRVWRLLDMAALPAWTRGRLALLGDAAHPFLPHQGQGASQALEDAACLGVVLGRGLRADEVADRLRLYERIRRARAHRIQEFSRRAGMDWVDGKPQVDMIQFTDYNFGHDEVDHSHHCLRQWLWERNGRRRGAPNPRNGFLAWEHPSPSAATTSHASHDAPADVYDAGTRSTTVTATVTFVSSRTVLQTLFPGDPLRRGGDDDDGEPFFRFASANTRCRASLVVTSTAVHWLPRPRTTIHRPPPSVAGRTRASAALHVHCVEFVVRPASGCDTTSSAAEDAEQRPRAAQELAPDGERVLAAGTFVAAAMHRDTDAAAAARAAAPGLPADVTAELEVTMPAAGYGDGSRVRAQYLAAAAVPPAAGARGLLWDVGLHDLALRREEVDGYVTAQHDASGADDADDDDTPLLAWRGAPPPAWAWGGDDEGRWRESVAVMARGTGIGLPDRVAGPARRSRRRVFRPKGPPKRSCSLDFKNPYLRGGGDDSLLAAVAEALSQVPVLELVAVEVCEDVEEW